MFSAGMPHRATASIKLSWSRTVSKCWMGMESGRQRETKQYGRNTVDAL